MSLNKIAIRTNKGEYVGGEEIYGAVYLWICSTEACRAVKLKFQGYEFSKWDYPDVIDQNGRLEETVKSTKHKKEYKFKAEGYLAEYEASFKDSGYHGINKEHKWEAEIAYTVTAEVEMLGSRSGNVLQETQPLVINKNLPLSDIQGETVTDKTTITICCCIPRGDVSITACLDKKVYTSGETALLHVETKNSSSTEIKSFVVKLVRVVTLRPKKEKEKSPESSGSHSESTEPIIRSPCIPDNMLNIKGEGCSSKSTKTRDVDLLLRDESKNENFQASTDGKLIKSIYHIDAGVEIDYAFPVGVQIPVTIQAPLNKKWRSWEPPSWLYNCNIVNGNGIFQVPEQQLGSRLYAQIPGFQQDPFS